MPSRRRRRTLFNTTVANPSCGPPCSRSPGLFCSSGELGAAKRTPQETSGDAGAHQTTHGNGPITAATKPQARRRRSRNPTVFVVRERGASTTLSLGLTALQAPYRVAMHHLLRISDMDEGLAFNAKVGAQSPAPCTTCLNPCMVAPTLGLHKANPQTRSPEAGQHTHRHMGPSPTYHAKASLVRTSPTLIGLPTHPEERGGCCVPRWFWRGLLLPAE